MFLTNGCKLFIIIQLSVIVGLILAGILNLICRMTYMHSQTDDKRGTRRRCTQSKQCCFFNFERINQSNARLVTLFSLIVWIILTCLSCKDNPTNPVTTPTGKRNYIWTTDTLMYPVSYQTCMSSIYGTSANNVYICGHNDQNRGLMYHYDGKQWSPVSLTYSEGGPIQKGMDLNAMHGSGANDIWAVGYEGFGEPGTHIVIDSSLVIHYDGAQWSACNIPARGKSLYCVWSLSPTAVWAAGVGGLILWWNGSAWTKYEVGKQYFFSSIAALSPTEAYAFGHVSDNALPIDSSGSFLFKFNGTSWSIIDSVMRTPEAPPAHLGGVVYAAQGCLYTAGPNVYRRDGSQWTKLVDGEVGHMWQSVYNNIIVVGKTLIHFNGIDWVELLKLDPSFIWSGCYTDGNIIFVVGFDNYKTLVKHGK